MDLRTVTATRRRLGVRSGPTSLDPVDVVGSSGTSLGPVGHRWVQWDIVGSSGTSLGPVDVSGSSGRRFFQKFCVRGERVFSGPAAKCPFQSSLAPEQKCRSCDRRRVSPQVSRQRASLHASSFTPRSTSLTGPPLWRGWGGGGGGGGGGEQGYPNNPHQGRCFIKILLIHLFIGRRWRGAGAQRTVSFSSFWLEM